VVDALYRRITPLYYPGVEQYKCDMTKKISTANGEAQAAQTDAYVRISTHAQERWTERTSAQESLRAAWERSIRVRAPSASATEVRLYAPCEALLIYRQGALRTVLNNDGRIDCTALGACTACENLIDPVQDATCRWCGAETETHGRGRASVVRGDKA